MRQKVEFGEGISNTVKRGVFALLVVCSLFISLPMASAQAGTFDVSFGLGTAHDKSNGTGLDFNDLSTCLPASDLACSSIANHLSGVMMGFHGDYMMTKQYGFGGEVAFQPVRQQYVDFGAISPGEKIESRMTFYDFNGIARPLRGRRASLQLEGGLGGANLRFYDTVNLKSVLGNVNSSDFLSSVNHFQLHAAVSVPVYVTREVFVRPQFDLHYVPNLSDQYGRDVVPQVMVYVGYTFGRR